MWHGVSNVMQKTDEQAYYTGDLLAQRTVALAQKHAPPLAVYFDAGVGSGALYAKLPSPKSGVELRSVRPRLQGVTYGVDFLEWAPPKEWTKKHIVAVCNPPFRLQVEFLNKLCTIECASLTVVCIAGLSVRMWETEDMIDARLHLVEEWLTPKSMSEFQTPRGPRTIRTTVQVWRRSERRRALWKDISFPGAPAFTTSVNGSLVVTRLNSPCQVGCAGVLGRDVRLVRGKYVLTPRGRRAVEASQPPLSCTIVSDSLGTKNTAMTLMTPRADDLLRRIHKQRRRGVFYDLLKHRNTTNGVVSLSASTLRRMLSKTWRRLKRPIHTLR